MRSSTKLRTFTVLAGFLGLFGLLPTAGHAQNCEQTAVGLVPLDDLSDGTYQGFQGGLYPAGELARPAAHDAAGLALADAVVPRDGQGAPSPAGEIGLVAIGMSNTTQEFSRFIAATSQEPGLDPALSIVDAAQPGQSATQIATPSASYWSFVDQRVGESGLTPAQVQVVWLKQANRVSEEPFPDSALALQADLANIVRILGNRFPNLRLCYLSSRIYAGYSAVPQHREPDAFESGLAVKWLIEAQIQGDPTLNYDPEAGPVRAPWLAWGPYLWADGTCPRSDGLQWDCTDLEPDGVHPSESGEIKVANLLLDFFRTDATAKTWFLASPTTLCATQARVEKYGTAVSGSGGEVQLVASTLPTLPTPVPFRAHVFGAPEGALAVFVQGFSARQAGAFPLFGGSLLVKVSSSRAATTNACGKATVSYGALPDEPGFCGLDVFFQAGVKDPTAPQGWSLTRGLKVEVGH